MLSPDIENPGDRVEVAFRRLDTDGDGYIEEEEFTQVKTLNLTSWTNWAKISSLKLLFWYVWWMAGF